MRINKILIQILFLFVLSKILFANEPAIKLNHITTFPIFQTEHVILAFIDHNTLDSMYFVLIPPIEKEGEKIEKNLIKYFKKHADKNPNNEKYRLFNSGEQGYFKLKEIPINDTIYTKMEEIKIYGKDCFYYIGKITKLYSIDRIIMYNRTLYIRE